MSSLFYATLGPELAGRWKLNPDGHLEIHANNIEEARQIVIHWFGYDAAATVTIHRPDTPQNKRPATESHALLNALRKAK